MIYNGLSPRERNFVDDLVSGEKYDTVYRYKAGDDTYYITSVDGELAIHVYSETRQVLNLIGDYASVWTVASSYEKSEPEFIRKVLSIAPLSAWEAIAFDINHL